MTEEGTPANDTPRPANEAWPELPFPRWQGTCETLQLWLQIVGKIRLTYVPWTNHQWHGTLYVTSRGLTTGPIPYGRASFQFDVDLLDHHLRVSASDGQAERVALRPRSVADFHRSLLAKLARMGFEVDIHGVPNEVPDPIPFAEDDVHKEYDPEYASRFFRVLRDSSRVFTAFRARFIGKSSPVHFFWGAMDLAVTRFSGRRAPTHPGGVPGLPDWVTREAYSHEVVSAGFWPGGEAYPTPLFYAYAYPEPEGFAAAGVEPAAAHWDSELSEFVLPYEAVRAAPDPEGALSAFLQSTYEEAARLAGWDRESLEWQTGERPLGRLGGYAMEGEAERWLTGRDPVG